MPVITDKDGVRRFAPRTYPKEWIVAIKARSKKRDAVFEPLFWAQVKVGDVQECWPWMAHRKQNGYGEINFLGKQQSSHRVAYILTYGRINNGYYVCHRCDNKPCCNPLHLFVGTPKDNTQDCINKGLMPRAIGEKNGMFGRRGSKSPSSVLTEAQVIEMRRKYATGIFTQHQLAKQYDTTQINVSVICRRKTWTHI